MKKSFLVVLSIFVLVLSLSGCGRTKEPIDSLIANYDYKTFFEENIPNPRKAFPDHEVDITVPASSGDFYEFYVRGVSQEEYYNYVDSLDKNVFTKEYYYLNNMYNAATGERYEDRYAIYIGYSEGNQDFMVQCWFDEKNENEKENE